MSLLKNTESPVGVYITLKGLKKNTPSSVELLLT